MRLTLIALLLAGVVGCDSMPQGLSASAQAVFRRAQQGDADAQHALGLMYANGKGVPHDWTEAVKWFRKAAEQGHADGQVYLGQSYHLGEGVPEDDTEAVKWWRRAAEQGHAEAQFLLGSMYYNGLGVPQDDVEAYAWYSVADENGDEDAIGEQEIVKAKLTPEQLARGQGRAAKFLKQINANKAE